MLQEGLDEIDDQGFPLRRKLVVVECEFFQVACWAGRQQPGSAENGFGQNIEGGGDLVSGFPSRRYA